MRGKRAPIGSPPDAVLAQIGSADVPGYDQQVAKGLIIVIAMLLQNGTGWLRR